MEIARKKDFPLLINRIIKPLRSKSIELQYT